MFGRSWTEISVDTIISNYNIYIKELLGQGQELMAVVKADAYGHGDLKTALRLQEVGCKNFAVSNLEEAIGLRTAGIKGQILILGYTPVDCAEQLKEYDITQALLSEEYAEKLADKSITAQFAIDTGMNRIGLDGDDIAYCEQVIRKYVDRFNLTGIFTHYCVADTESENDFTKGQREKFKAVANAVSDLKLPYVHCMNSAGGLFHGGENAFGNLVRLGIVMYGLKPDYVNVLPEGIKPALSWKTVVSMVKPVHIGESVGYGRTFKATREMLVATLPTGYADGYSRLLSNKGCVIINGQKAHIIGNICMDQMTVDITDIKDVVSGDVVTLIGDGYTADDMAHTIGTIGYEIICGITGRVKRVYVEES